MTVFASLKRGGAVLLRRRGAVTVEAAVVYPLLFLLLFGLIVGGITVSRYQQVAMLAREGARFASVRGADWKIDWQKQPPGQPAATVAQIRQDAVLPMAVSLDPNQLTVQVQWVCPTTGQVVDWDSSTKSPTTLNPQGAPVANHVRVTIIYQWDAGILFPGPLTLKSVCEIPMSF